MIGLLVSATGIPMIYESYILNSKAEVFEEIFGVQ